MRTKRKLCSLVAALLALASTATSQLHVPGDYADLQAALDAAPPGEVILVHGGSWEALVISKSVTLIGDPQPTLLSKAPVSFGSRPEPAVLLAGPGSGEVALVNVMTDGPAPPPFSLNTPSIVGGGFSELHILDSTIQSPPLVLFDSVTPGEPGVDVTIPYTVIERCTVKGSAAGDASTLPSEPGGPGLRTTGTVLVLDSSVSSGGFARPYYWGGPCSSVCPPGNFGKGGPGVVADVLVESGSTISGSAGALFHTVIPPQNLCCQGKDGEDVVASLHLPLVDDLSLVAPVRVGGSVWVNTNTCACPAFALISGSVEVPTFLPLYGLLFLHVPSARVAGVIPSASGSQSPYVAASIPPNPNLLGVNAAMQLYSTNGLSRPITFVVEP